MPDNNEFVHSCTCREKTRMHELHQELANILTNNVKSAIDLLLQEFSDFSPEDSDKKKIMLLYVETITFEDLSNVWQRVIDTNMSSALFLCSFTRAPFPEQTPCIFCLKYGDQLTSVSSFWAICRI